MGLFGRIFGRKGKEEAPAAPAPTPAPPPAAGPPPEGKKPGLFGRLKDKVRRKPKEAPPEAPPTAPAAPPTPPGPPSPPPAPPTPGEPVPEGEQGELFEAEEEDAYAGAPGSLHVVIPGTWKTSKRAWNGVVDGTLYGDDVVEFLKAMDGKGSLEDAIEKVCKDFDEQFASALEIENSSWSTPQY